MTVSPPLPEMGEGAPVCRSSRLDASGFGEMVSENGTPLLTVNNVEVIYDHVILVLKGVSLEDPRKGISALLGANGAAGPMGPARPRRSRQSPTC
jgi:hypothetical protein